ncbi:CDK-activating kinase assembly factor MAT1 [Fukomys damarensis]|uniref:CDK-activating kinase assembly factor MAT1 n=1 Tax=Fukomys damarensis TaxID=885580 RepID=A0A091DJH1_FUKDA|nr:CDK-activating kinase assembly factor MAT1 [Fukomys damarensis]
MPFMTTCASADWILRLVQSGGLSGVARIGVLQGHLRSKVVPTIWAQAGRRENGSPPSTFPWVLVETREQEELEEALEVERQENEQRRLFLQKEEQLQQILKRKNKQAFLDELESSDLPVALLLAQHKDRSTQLEMQVDKPKPVKPVTFSTGIKMGQHISLAPLQKLEEALYEYHPLQIESCGPPVPELELLGRLGCGSILRDLCLLTLVDEEGIQTPDLCWMQEAVGSKGRTPMP